MRRDRRDRAHAVEQEPRLERKENRHLVEVPVDVRLEIGQGDVEVGGLEGERLAIGEAVGVGEELGHSCPGNLQVDCQMRLQKDCQTLVTLICKPSLTAVNKS